jgi:hypothetical protein
MVHMEESSGSAGVGCRPPILVYHEVRFLLFYKLTEMWELTLQGVKQFLVVTLNRRVRRFVRWRERITLSLYSFLQSRKLPGSL